MARIRTIKPEFPQSESVGRMSRDARLLYIMLWTIADDEGRTRANSRMLASLLYPYDDDAKDLLPGWLDELEAEGCIRRYEFEGATYLDIPKWTDHQKIDKPSRSKLPKFEDGTRSVPEFREHSRHLATTSRGVVVGPGPGPGPGKDQEGIIAGSADADCPAADLRVECELALEAYRQEADRHGWPKPQNWTPERQKALRGRLRECGGIDGWREAMRKAGASAFLTGKTGRTDTHANWRPSIDFFLKKSKLTALMEGGYDGNDTGRQSLTAHFRDWANPGEADPAFATE